VAEGPDCDVLARELGQIAADLAGALLPRGAGDTLQAIVDTAALVFDAGACSVAVLDEGSEELVFVATSRGPGDPILGRRLTVGRGIAGWAVSSGQAIAINEVDRDERFARDLAGETGYVPSTILAMPIETRDDVLGVLSLLDRRPQPREMELVSAFARQAALAISSVRAFADLGRVLLTAAADAASDTDIAGALRRAAGEVSDRPGELAELAAAFAELGRLGPEERASATRLVTHFLTYANARQR
jgi:GAF domain-containing protein